MEVEHAANEPRKLGTSKAMSKWLPCETGKHQDHVIAHVVGATVLGYFEFDQTAHLLLDIGFLWTIYPDGEMGLLTQSLAISELELEADAKAGLATDVQMAHDGRLQAEDSMLIAAPEGCLITAVEFYAQSDRRRILVTAEEASLVVDSSLASGEMTIRPLLDDASTP